MNKESESDGHPFKHLCRHQMTGDTQWRRKCGWFQKCIRTWKIDLKIDA